MVHVSLWRSSQTLPPMPVLAVPFLQSLRPHRCLVLVASALAIGAQGLRGQDASTGRPSSMLQLAGTVISRGQPVAAANVFDLQTLEGALTDSLGRFRFAVTDTTGRTVRLAVRRVGFRPSDTTVVIGPSLTLELSAITDLAIITVSAGQYTSSAARTATLSPLEVATTPGTNADVNSAIKTLPGVQNVDEGNGVFVHGGDATETRTFVDGAPLFSAYQFEAPTGSVAGTINPFLLDKITFSSGGFHAGWGNALSGVVDLRTQGRPRESFLTGNASAFGAAMSGGLALRRGFGAAATLSITDLRTMFAVNGNPRAFAPAPHGGVASGTIVWDYGKANQLKLFALRQDNRLGVPLSDPAFDGTFRSHRTGDLAVASWQSAHGNWQRSASLSTTGMERRESFGTYALQNTLRSQQLRGAATYERFPRALLTLGGEVERLAARFNSRFPAFAFDRGPGAASMTTASERVGVRDAQFLSLETRPFRTVQLIVGARRDRSSLSTRHSVDPRVSLAWVARPHLTATAAWGVYHQVVDPAFLDRLDSRRVLPSTRSMLAIGGAQLGDGASVLRVEGWFKRYENLAALNRAYRTVADLAGRAEGVDVFARHAGPLRSRWRVTYSLAHTRRTDPNTGQEAKAEFDVPHSVTVVGERNWRGGWTGALAWRYATGRPFTDIAGGRLDTVTFRHIPIFGDPNAVRLPAFQRVDLSFSRARPFGAGRFAVLFGGITNLLNTGNLFGYSWNRDYSERRTVPSSYNRSVFLGMNLSLTQTP